MTASDLVSSRAETPHYDSARRRRATRGGRDKGCRVYIPADELVRAGHDPDGPPPYYRVWGSSRGSVLLRLYREP